MRYSYEDGSLNDDIPGTYLYGGLESDISDFAFSYWSKDVNCDGDQNDMIREINESGVAQGYTEVWDGTIDNPEMPLPNNIKYTYYVSDADGVVDEIRQWLYTGGDGSTPDFNSGQSVPQPHDGEDYRLSDRFNVSRFHLNQSNDIDNVMRTLDEPDYPAMSYTVLPDIQYFGLAQRRADKVPADSEYSLMGNNEIDCDWYVVDLLDTFYQLEILLLPHPSLSGRIDLYAEVSNGLSNDLSADTSMIFSVGTDSFRLRSPADNYTTGKYYIRISHDIFSSAGPINETWKIPYQFKVITGSPCVDHLFVSGIQLDNTYRLSHSIVSDAMVVDSGYLNFHAGNYIELLPGFEVGHQAEFLGRIDTCFVD